MSTPHPAAFSRSPAAMRADMEAQRERAARFLRPTSVPAWKRRWRTDDDIAVMAALSTGLGATQRMIANRFGVSRSTVCRYLRHHRSNARA